MATPSIIQSVATMLNAYQELLQPVDVDIQMAIDELRQGNFQPALVALQHLQWQLANLQANATGLTLLGGVLLLGSAVLTGGASLIVGFGGMASAGGGLMYRQSETKQLKKVEALFVQVKMAKAKAAAQAAQAAQAAAQAAAKRRNRDEDSN